MTAFAGLQFWQHGVCHVYIVTIPCTIGDTKYLHIRVLTQILQLILLVVGVYRYQHSTDLGSSIEESKPVGHVCGPDTHVRTFLYTYADQTLGEIVHTLVELTPCES